ncbi:uncharacterized protein PFLUO_LOCUS968 [Penicillium psychrofluorescens]|uniref:uncharacterized protein n=1 Tax=Penicillium psychrofluorescens TaxID=3158075 RepID=UPI003CCDB84E
MAPPDDGFGPRKRRKISPKGTVPYILRTLFDQVPLTVEENSSEVHITCVEYWNENLYIGTSAAEILHFVCLPASDESNEPTFILASRLPIFYVQDAAQSNNQPGVQQIVILSSVNKACVLCNGTVTFYLLPELSPAFDSTKVNPCRWIGGLDLNRDPMDEEPPTVMIAMRNRIMLVQIGDEAKRIKKIDFPSCLVAARRGTIACAADTRSYSLLEVEQRQKISLFPISSLNEVFEPGQMEEMTPASHTSPRRSPSSSYPSSPPVDAQVHARSTSLNAFVGMLQPEAQASQQDRASAGTPDPFTSSGTLRRSSSSERDEVSKEVTDETEAPSAATDSTKPLPPLPKPTTKRLLQPHVASPTPSEFLLVTGTDEMEPGVGMFVDMDGEVVRGTINFHKYPKSIAIDMGEDDHLLQPNDEDREEWILAVIDDSDEQEPSRYLLEMQRWDDDPAEIERNKRWIELPCAAEATAAQVGLGHTISPSHLELDDIGKILQMVRLKTSSLLPYTPDPDPRTQASIEHIQREKELLESQESTDSEGPKKPERASSQNWEIQRIAEEARFARGLGKLQSSLLVWSGSQIWRVLRNPLVVQLEDSLQNAQKDTVLDRDAVVDLMMSFQDTEPKSEAEFIGLGYMKQKASLLLYGDLFSMKPENRSDAVIDSTERALLIGDLDPRLALLFIPLLRCEVLQGPQGIWIHAGLATVVEKYIEAVGKADHTSSRSSVLDMVKRFLISWQQKRGYGSITDEDYVFDSTDAALLHLLLEQDTNLTAGQGTNSSTRTELNRLVDNWKGNFERAVALLEEYRRLFLLSRLYQSQKMSGNVLKTWRRIIDGENDAGGEITVASVEAQMRRYLVRIKDTHLVEEYGAWLAGRNAELGIQVFADNSSRVRIDPTDVVELLKERAPNAVQVYLEHLVFAKNYTQYADDLISYYLDTVLSVLQSSPAARNSLSESYSTYRALRPPKPTYLNFITENTPAEPWWQSRLRLLQLLGGSSGTQFTTSPVLSGISYSIPAVLERIEPFQNELVSECIILDGLQGHHRAALRLLTHGLGDYDSAIRYCLFGGPRHQTGSSAPPELAEHGLQSTLFRHLLDEFLQIQDLSDRIERTSDLLARFAAWFDVREVLDLVPEAWSVDIVGGFLVHVFRSLVSQSREARVERALSASLNLRVGVECIDGMEKAGPWVEETDGVRRLKDLTMRPLPRPPGEADADDADEGGDDGDVDDYGDMVHPVSDT